jgi:hypothetical protein
MHLVRRILLPAASSWWLLPFVATLAGTTALPWFVCKRPVSRV